MTSWSRDLAAVKAMSHRTLGTESHECARLADYLRRVKVYRQDIIRYSSFIYLYVQTETSLTTYGSMPEIIPRLIPLEHVVKRSLSSLPAPSRHLLSALIVYRTAQIGVSAWSLAIPLEGGT